MARYLNVNAPVDSTYNRPVMTLVVNVDDKEFEFIIDSHIAVAKIVGDLFKANPEKRIDVHISNRVIRVEETREVIDALYHAGLVKNQF